MRLPLRRTKIIATLGPATAGRGVLSGLLRAGVDVTRLNLSHGDRTAHARTIVEVRRAAAIVGRPVAILADLQGAKARVGRLTGGGPLPLRRGERVVLTSRRLIGRRGLIPVSHPFRARDARPGDPILIDDGRIELETLRRPGGDALCRVVTGGLLLEHKGVNLPGAERDTGPLTAKDRADLAFAVAQNVDYVALSFVRSGEDVETARRLLRRRGRRSIPIIAKLELRRAVERLPGILSAADGVMVARGDLGVEVPLESVPVLQKRILQEANRAGVIAITATQMLESMVAQPRPTRAEASDVANAIFDGTDAVMLSAETASGRYPVRVVRVMDRIVREAERSGLQWPRPASGGGAPATGEVRAVAHAAVDAAREWGARAVVVYTQTGETARVLSKLRPPCSIFALTPTERARRRMALYWGVTPLVMRFSPSTDRMLRDGQRALLAARLLKRRERVVVVSGTSMRAGATNLMKLHRVGEER